MYVNKKAVASNAIYGEVVGETETKIGEYVSHFIEDFKRVLTSLERNIPNNYQLARIVKYIPKAIVKNNLFVVLQSSMPYDECSFNNYCEEYYDMVNVPRQYRIYDYEGWCLSVRMALYDDTVPVVILEQWIANLCVKIMELVPNTYCRDLLFPGRADIKTMVTCYLTGTGGYYAGVLQSGPAAILPVTNVNKHIIERNDDFKLTSPEVLVYCYHQCGLTGQEELETAVMLNAARSTSSLCPSPFSKQLDTAFNFMLSGHFKAQISGSLELMRAVIKLRSSYVRNLVHAKIEHDNRKNVSINRSPWGSKLQRTVMSKTFADYLEANPNLSL